MKITKAFLRCASLSDEQLQLIYKYWVRAMILCDAKQLITFITLAGSSECSLGHSQCFGNPSWAHAEGSGCFCCPCSWHYLLPEAELQQRWAPEPLLLNSQLGSFAQPVISAALLLRARGIYTALEGSVSGASTAEPSGNCASGIYRTSSRP